MIRVFIGILAISIMMSAFLNGDELEDKYRNFMNMSKVSPPSKTALGPEEKASNSVEKRNKKTVPQQYKELKKESTASAESENQQGLANKFFSWIKSFSADTEEKIQVKQNKIYALKSSRRILDDKIKKIDADLTIKVENQGLIRSLFDDTEEVDSLEELREEMVEKKEMVEEDIETLTEEIGELGIELLRNE